MLPVSGRQFAKMVGMSSDNAVRKAVERGSILKGYIKSEKKFIPKVAAMEWGKDILPEYGGPKPRKVPRMANKPAPPKPKKITAEDVVKEILAEPVPKPKKKADDTGGFLFPDDDDDDEDEHEEGWISKPEAERRTAIHKSEILEIALAEKRGQLIPKDKISGILFGYGQEVRIAVEGITNRVLDPIMAAEDRHVAKRILDEEIHATLTALAEIPNREI